MHKLNPYQDNYKKVLREAERDQHEKKFAFQLKAMGIVGLEYWITDWAPGRKIEFDVAHRASKVAVEIQGGVFGQTVYCHQCHARVMKPAKGRWVPVREAVGHARADTLKRDFEKIVIAQRLGWILIPIHPDSIEDGSGAKLFQEVINERMLSLP